MLRLRHATVIAVGPEPGPIQRLEISIDGAQRGAICDVALMGPAVVGDQLIVNVEALDLGLGSGGFDVVHVNLTRGLDHIGPSAAHVMKLNYTSLQHVVAPVEGDAIQTPVSRPVAIIGLHGQLAPVTWAALEHSPGLRIGFVQTVGGALPGGLSDVVRELRARAMLDGYVTAGAAYGGEREALTTIGAIEHGCAQLGWTAAICGPGPGIIGSASALGHGGMVALDSAHAALALGAPTILVPRMSSGDQRERHRGLSHHTRTVLELLLAPVVVGLPVDTEVDVPSRHERRPVDVDVDGYRASGLPIRTMGRTIDEDPLFFAAALAGGTALALMASQ